MVQQEFVGVTNENCLVNYSNYRSIFPMRLLESISAGSWLQKRPSVPPH
ncbi:hypothetical protein BAE44_0002093 [Dichanthelium oligosanthes]|uniref:Uncharacterized protein n=1 Tax=Dichanthelium oligosanthes TaxID=888268 RepID=A0A1E5WHP8_9POAL|nr:hypothetical protein BAE44_0002093 [Dichanthelium oligosanthes]